MVGVRWRRLLKLRLSLLVSEFSESKFFDMLTVKAVFHFPLV